MVLKLDGEEIKGRQNKPNIKPVPAHTSVLLTDHRDSPDHNPKDFEYRQVIGKLLYLEKSTRTKHLNIKYHHFREEVRKGTVSIYHTRTEDQIADIFTKPLPEASFVKFRERMMGW